MSPETHPINLGGSTGDRLKFCVISSLANLYLVINQ